MTPALYLIPTVLGDSPAESVFPPANREIIKGIKHFIVEETRTARRFLKFMDKEINIDELTFYPMGKHSDAMAFDRYLAPLKRGEAMGMISEAGCPAVADPGATIVAMAANNTMENRFFIIVKIIRSCKDQLSKSSGHVRVARYAP